MNPDKAEGFKPVILDLGRPQTNPGSGMLYGFKCPRCRYFVQPLISEKIICQACGYTESPKQKS